MNLVSCNLDTILQSVTIGQQEERAGAQKTRLDKKNHKKS